MMYFICIIFNQYLASTASFNPKETLLIKSCFDIAANALSAYPLIAVDDSSNFCDNSSSLRLRSFIYSSNVARENSKDLLTSLRFRWMVLDIIIFAADERFLLLLVYRQKD